jgi:hypothetical protein
VSQWFDPGHRGGELGWTVAIVAPVVVLVSAAVALSLVAPTLASIVWIGIPLCAGIVWLADGYQPREIASWAVPLAGLALVAQFLPGRIGVPLASIVCLCTILLVLSPAARKRWLEAVRPHLGIGFSPAQELAAQLLDIHKAVGDGLKQYDRDADAERLHRRAADLLSRARDLRTDEVGPNEALTLLLTYLESLDSVTADPRDQPQAAFEGLDDQLRALRDAIKALVNQRS